MSDTLTSLVSVRQAAGVRTVILNRPEARNALSPALRTDLRAALLEADDDNETRCIVLTGAGGNFSAGGDVKRMGSNTPSRGSARLALGRELVELVRGVKKPTIAAVEGHAVGAGFGLALATDLIVVSETARFQFGFIKRGLAPDSAVPYLLSQQIGNRRTMFYAMTGEVISAGTAVELGIAAHVYPADGFAENVASFAESLANGPTAALFATRKIVQASHNLTMAQAWDMEAFAAAVTTTTEDHKNSVAAFKAKTPYTFKGE
ncbi:enoyl-CoA hydratase/isomerase family protein [Arthrobacter crystallopoietes]|uniref:enoyl-CoA hydratase/isomerase family protein n=1 Tax=Crystallibacter crystallopoietes TaxID=37928 RepID=UPI0011112C3D|nr:enoyl-CoA hydratase/isomerase family protein [Arthrobacter crystallopoietes]